MLRSQQLVADINKELECPICLERLSNPRCLACNHVYCLECLQELEAASGLHNSVLCPECRHRTFMGEDKTVADLHRPVPLRKLEAVCDSLEDFVRNVENTTSLNDTCEFCRQDGESRPYVAFCFQCRALLCNECTVKHGTLPTFQGHPLTRNVKFCFTHHAKVSTMFCGDCCLFVCHLCAVAAKHIGHSVDPLSIAVNKQRRKTDKLMNTVATFIASLQDLNMNIDGAIRQLRSQGNSIQQQITRNQRQQQRNPMTTITNQLQQHIACQENALHEFQNTCGGSITVLNQHIEQFDQLCTGSDDQFTFLSDIIELSRDVESELEYIGTLSVDMDIPSLSGSDARALSTCVTRSFSPAVKDNEAVGTQISSATQDGSVLSNHNKTPVQTFMKRHAYLYMCGLILSMSFLLLFLLVVFNACTSFMARAFRSVHIIHETLDNIGAGDGLHLDYIISWKAWFVLCWMCSTILVVTQYLFNKGAQRYQ